jgi:RimJ/RimL family protein N-acetyltransferase
LRDVALPALEGGTAWHWSIRLRSEPQRIIGSAGVMDGDESNRGFWLGAAWQRQGLMSEVSEAITDYWFDVLQRNVLRVFKAIENSGSRRLSEKTGMRVVERRANAISWAAAYPPSSGRSPRRSGACTAPRDGNHRVSCRIPLPA